MHVKDGVVVRLAQNLVDVSGDVRGCEMVLDAFECEAKHIGKSTIVDMKYQRRTISGQLTIKKTLKSV